MRISKKEFRRRLEAMPPEAPCGDERRCPIIYVFAMKRDSQAVYGENMPQWAKDFAERVDLRYEFNWSAVTVARALEILDAL